MHSLCYILCTVLVDYFYAQLGGSLNPAKPLAQQDMEIFMVHKKHPEEGKYRTCAQKEEEKGEITWKNRIN